MANNTSSSSSSQEPWLYTLLVFLLTYLVMMPVTLLMLGIGRPFKGWLSRVLDLPARTSWWKSWSWLLRPVQWIAALAFFLCLFQFLQLPHIQDVREQWLFLLQKVAICLSAALVFDLFAWLDDYADDPVVQKRLAGERAEQLVRELVDGYRDQSPDARSLHGGLFVFYAGSPQEFSVEVDHLLVTRRNVFVIETKYKSGTITATAGAAEWKVETSSGSGTMRNALKQAKNAGGVLQERLSLPCEVVPVVAITGNDVRIVDGPTNVVGTYDLPGTLHAFEFMQEMRIANPEHVLVQLRKYLSIDPAARERHIARAEAARIRGEMADIVQAASLQ